MLEEIMERLKGRTFQAEVLVVFEDYINALRTRSGDYSDGLHYGFVAGLLYSFFAFNIVERDEWLAALAEVGTISAAAYREEAADASGI